MPDGFSFTFHNPNLQEVISHRKSIYVALYAPDLWNLHAIVQLEAGSVYLRVVLRFGAVIGSASGQLPVIDSSNPFPASTR
jgi:hypothetical protein